MTIKTLPRTEPTWQNYLPRDVWPLSSAIALAHNLEPTTGMGRVLVSVVFGNPEGGSEDRAPLVVDDIDRVRRRLTTTASSVRPVLAPADAELVMSAATLRSIVNACSHENLPRTNRREAPMNPVLSPYVWAEWLLRHDKTVPPPLLEKYRAMVAGQSEVERLQARISVLEDMVPELACWVHLRARLSLLERSVPLLADPLSN